MAWIGKDCQFDLVVRRQPCGAGRSILDVDDLGHVASDPSLSHGRKVTTQPPFLPQELYSLQLPCGSCGRSVAPDLWRRHNDPFGPVYPAGTKGEKGAWVQQSVSVTCDCGKQIQFPLNPKRLDHPVSYFGDDADRDADEWFLHTYSLVGATSGPCDEIRRGVQAIKRKHCPDRDPASWKLHATKMMSGQQRAKDPVYRSLDYATVLDIFHECAGIAKEHESYTWNAAIFGFVQPLQSDPKQASRVKAHAKEVAHVALLSSCIYRTTKQSLRPLFTLDASRPIKTAEHIEGWSTTSYLGSRHYLAHEFLSHGNDIAAPRFVQPGSDPMLELADVHAYFLARHLNQRRVQSDSEIALEEFGKFHYMCVLSDHAFESFVADSIPSKFIPPAT